MTTIAKISACTTTACAFNDNQGCTAFAITVGGAEQAACNTMNTADLRAGLDAAEGQVGACQRLDCTYNADLMCHATGITISGDTALCTTYEAR